MEQPVTTIKVTEVSPDSVTPEADLKRKIEEENLEEVLNFLAATLTPTEEDKDQVSFVTAVQMSRKFLLDYAMRDYVIKQSSGKLEVIISLIAAMEKAVRDDRKERAKKQENQDNAISFKQMLDAMSMFKQGTVTLPVFDISTFMPDPNKSAIDGLVGVKPITDAELVQGMQTLDLNGQVVK